MRRRAAVALFAALALLVPSAAATALAHAESNPHSAPARAAVVDPHATVGHVTHIGPSTSSGRERRPSQGPAVAAVPGRGLGIAPAIAWAHLDAVVSSPAGDLPAGSRPRAPPVV
jgi:hypothetical protein